ncbi:hypothetical protein DN069_26365 [Streptacidiphilus pinicola]|uniref:Uncharacterized protein n=1 Tax=Streptacidiphilus pinicola TaxID=2219663 RepID=A0A2X0J5H7_9ACTN|nr:hypothetical protein [Streptacidiphilus pinicola]RAG82648.1 hypothetical protein DN069_26365 [Streptacidiphilus pinicola]
MAARQSKKLRRSAEDLLRRTGMSGAITDAGTPGAMPRPMSGMGGPGAAGPMNAAFAHHAADDRRAQRTGSRMAAAHDLVPGHRHRGAEQHSALSGR